MTSLAIYLEQKGCGSLRHQGLHRGLSACCWLLLSLRARCLKGIERWCGHRALRELAPSSRVPRVNQTKSFCWHPLQNEIMGCQRDITVPQSDTSLSNRYCRFHWRADETASNSNVSPSNGMHDTVQDSHHELYSVGNTSVLDKVSHRLRMTKTAVVGRSWWKKSCLGQLARDTGEQGWPLIVASPPSTTARGISTR